jgi:hypothetical protein
MRGSALEHACAVCGPRPESERERREPDMSRRRMVQIGIAVVALSLTLGMVPIPAPAVEVGDKAPDFVMHSTTAETLRLSDYQGKKNVLLFFFLAAFTGV